MEAKALCRLHYYTIGFLTGALTGGEFGLDDVSFLWTGCLRGPRSDLRDHLRAQARAVRLVPDHLCNMCSLHKACSADGCYSLRGQARTEFRRLADIGVGRVRVVPSDIAVFDVVVGYS